jgi:T4-like virus tail tube protein gp19.
MGFDMGLGKIGMPATMLKRQFRWTFWVEFEPDSCLSGIVPSSWVKVAARPNLDIDETQIDFLNGRTWIPGKGSWQTMTVTYYDAITADLAPLWSWLATVYNFVKPNQLHQASKRKDYGGKAHLELYDGCGNYVEKWTLKDCWPKAVNFGTLDYASSDVVTVELTLRYSQVEYEQTACGGAWSNCCNACDG